MKSEKEVDEKLLEIRAEIQNHIKAKNMNRVHELRIAERVLMWMTGELNKLEI